MQKLYHVIHNYTFAFSSVFLKVSIVLIPAVNAGLSQALRPTSDTFVRSIGKRKSKHARISSLSAWACRS